MERISNVNRKHERILTGCGDDALNAMERYLRFGVEAIGNVHRDLVSSPMDWRRYYTSSDLQSANPYIGKWDAPMLGGFYWYVVCWVRTYRLGPPQPLGTPDIAKLCEDCHLLLKQKSVHQAHRTVLDIVLLWDLICYMSDGRLNESDLDDSTLSNAEVTCHVNEIQSHGQLWLDVKLSEMTDGGVFVYTGREIEYW